jgi:hypothetical protein
MSGAFGVLVEKAEEKKQLGKPRRGWEVNIKMNLHKVGWRHDLD